MINASRLQVVSSEKRAAPHARLFCIVSPEDSKAKITSTKQTHQKLVKNG